MLDTTKLLDKEYIRIGAVILAAVLSGPLVDEVRDTFGTTVLFHPVTVWAVLFCIVFANTKSFKASVGIVILYELIKYIWQKLSLEPTQVARVRKILHNVHAGAEMSENDVRYLNKVTPSNVEVVKKNQ